MNDDQILNEYSKIFGDKKHTSLFTPDEEYETTLRQEIINSPHVTYEKSKLPFEGIETKPYNPSSETDLLHKKIVNIIADLSRAATRKEEQSNKLFEFPVLQQNFKPSVRSVSKVELLFKIHEKQKKHIEHIFGISYGSIQAFGYPCLDSSNFCILKHSKVALSSEKYRPSLFECKRLSFISKDCMYEDGHYTLKHDKLCTSPEEAAFFICGVSLQENLWIDEKEVTINQFLHQTRVKATSDNIVVTNQRKRISVDPHHYFYLKKTKSRYCDAKGYYDLNSNNFIIKKGSLLSLITSSSCYNSLNSGVYREEFLEKYCTREVLAFKLNCDYICDSPSEAVAYCLGRSASGWTEWKDEQGNTLKSVYKK